MPGSISGINMLSQLPQSYSPSSQAIVSPLSRSLSALTPEPATATDSVESTVYVELRTLSAEEKSQYATDLSDSAITYEEAFPEREMQGIIGELKVDNALFYFVRLSDGQAFRVFFLLL